MGYYSVILRTPLVREYYLEQDLSDISMKSKISECVVQKIGYCIPFHQGNLVKMLEEYVW